ncbi:hypothetical protein M406DRAFT_38721 [Cryphonectria parasitica EP155]|uniref:Major facilitator superfamily (MFS) profile domain-containing protein n=1 Tax=Cryphonectria parasitica (strain ATCC 38755 / EP155) TaxID=660469 RepID=A0A9P4Y4L4_CRYP1|nr:uncharacterized protein M406DRAFT_38721 [Cryphonectria parasitica EP155]KAF3766364.1 hypothetical protein M406DRAFT_38721 [Cryphonectria parasitica EP155]
MSNTSKEKLPGDSTTDIENGTTADTSQELSGSADEKTAAPANNAWGGGGLQPPDGGATAWLCVLGVWCTSFCSFGWLNCTLAVGVFQDYYQSELLNQYSASTVAWIPSLQIFFMMGLGPFVGIIYDHYGPRLLLIVGTVLHVLGIMMTSLATEYYQILLAQGVCSAIGASCIFQPSVTCAAGWFNKKRGAAFGIMFTGSSIGGVIFPILVARLISEIGFPWAMRTCGFLILFLLIIANLTVRGFYPPSPHPVSATQLAKPLKEVDFLLITAGFFFFSYGFFVPIDYLPVQAIAAGMSTDLAAYLLSILNAGSLFGRLFAGFFGDKIGRYNIYVIVCYLSGLWILALWIPATGNGPLIAFAVLFGFFSGAYVSLITPLVMAISPFPELGFRVGIVMLLCAVAGLTANPINGALIDGASGWLGIKIWSGVFCVAGASFVLMVRVRRVGWKLAAVY